MNSSISGLLKLALVIGAVGISSGGIAAEPARDAVATTDYSYRAVVEELRGRHVRMDRRLDSIRHVLLRRANAEAPGLLTLLRRDISYRRGYGVVPSVLDDPPVSSVVPSERIYSLQTLRESSKQDFAAVKALVLKAFADRSPLLEPLVAEFERLTSRHDLLARHIAYHAHWQRAVIDYGGYFAKLNGLVAMARRSSGMAAEELRRAAIQKTSGLTLAPIENGIRRLPVTVVTDIEDEAFLAAFREGVEAAFVRSSPARSMGFAVDLRFQRISRHDLYPSNPPRAGESIDLRDHLSRFPADALVLTTGGDSTHAWTGRAVVLGPTPLTRRMLAHEFGHLLGFGDGYVRGFDGNPRDRFGAVLVEWHGLVDDLMGNSNSGRVSPRLIEALITTYDTE